MRSVGGGAVRRRLGVSLGASDGGDLIEGVASVVSG
jgi:hypothetical protein